MDGVKYKADGFIEQNRSFFKYLAGWMEKLEMASIESIIAKSGGPDKVAVVSVDLIEGFCRVGPLASDRVAAVIPGVVELMKNADKNGIKRIALVQDSHEDNADEFYAYPPHCVKGTDEAMTIEEIRQLSFFDGMAIITKNSIASHVGIGLENWLNKRELKTVIAVGDCTDLCLYQLALYIKLLSNERGYKWDVIVPENLVQTYDLSVRTAENIGALPHPGDLFHMLFLYHMMMNGVNVVKGIDYGNLNE